MRRAVERRRCTPQRLWPPDDSGSPPGARIPRAVLFCTDEAGVAEPGERIAIVAAFGAVGAAMNLVPLRSRGRRSVATEDAYRSLLAVPAVSSYPASAMIRLIAYATGAGAATVGGLALAMTDPVALATCATWFGGAPGALRQFVSQLLHQALPRDQELVDGNARVGPRDHDASQGWPVGHFGCPGERPRHTARENGSCRARPACRC